MLDEKTKRCSMQDSIMGMNYRSKLPEIIDSVVTSCSDKGCFEHIDSAVIPSRESIVEIIDLFKDVLFPGYFGDQTVERSNLIYHIGSEITELFEKLSRHC
ncbi:hypothetical protein [Methanococcoides seepicolus]|uniref:Uncharacterized protein n=1 Tax=Methanococcoides seepicolus TaxID=2828780 RepID=A0A9E4ZII8_9EURY|nr:hypothetical protein [Methanococcoides seepicolus]MCM1988097.1 hypothetical protein [Methanococcoides seepicolus]